MIARVPGLALLLAFSLLSFAAGRRHASAVPFEWLAAACGLVLGAGLVAMVVRPRRAAPISRRG